MKREKRLTKRERKAIEGPKPQAHVHGKAKAAADDHHHHIHCIACGKHLDAHMFGEPDGAEFLRCDHGSDFPHCVGCKDKAKELVAEHDRTGKPVQKVAAWH